MNPCEHPPQLAHTSTSTPTSLHIHQRDAMQTSTSSNPLPTPTSVPSLRCESQELATVPYPPAEMAEVETPPLLPPPKDAAPDSTKGARMLPAQRREDRQPPMTIRIPLRQDATAKNKVDAEVMAHPAIRTLDPHNAF